MFLGKSFRQLLITCSTTEKLLVKLVYCFVIINTVVYISSGWYKIMSYFFFENFIPIDRFLSRIFCFSAFRLERGVRSGDLFMSYQSIFQDIRNSVDWVHFHVSTMYFVNSVDCSYLF